jgi:predicted DNA-binding transcriptional regulator YafY
MKSNQITKEVRLSQVARLIGIAAMLADPKGVTTRQLRDRFEVSTRTLAYDRDFLQDRVGLVIEKIAARPGDNNTRYRANSAEVMPLVKTLNLFI